MLMIDPHHEISMYMSMSGQNPIVSNIDLLDEEYKRQIFVVTRRAFDENQTYKETTTTVKLSDVIAFIESHNVSKTTVAKPSLY